LLLDPGRENVGDLWLATIGFPSTYEGVVAHALDDAEFRAIVPRRVQSTEKRGAGAPLILAGSEQFPGAAVLCALGAARAGAGYVTVAAPEGAAPALRAHLLEQTLVTYDPRNVEASVETVVDDEVAQTILRHLAATYPSFGLIAYAHDVEALVREPS